MVADPAFRRRGLGEEAVQLLLGYAGTRGLNRFVAKVGSTNAPSLALFEKRLGFSRTAFVEAFDEVHLERRGAPPLAGTVQAYDAAPPPGFASETFTVVSGDATRRRRAEVAPVVPCPSRARPSDDPRGTSRRGRDPPWTTGRFWPRPALDDEEIFAASPPTLQKSGKTIASTPAGTRASSCSSRPKPRSAGSAAAARRRRGSARSAARPLNRSSTPSPRCRRWWTPRTRWARPSPSVSRSDRAASSSWPGRAATRRTRARRSAVTNHAGSEVDSTFAKSFSTEFQERVRFAS